MEQQQEAEKQRQEAKVALNLVEEIDRSTPFLKDVDRESSTPITSLAIDPSGQGFIIGNAGGEYGGEGPSQVTFKGKHAGPINSVAFSHDGRYVLTASSDKTAMISRIGDDDGAKIQLRHADAINHAVFSPDDRWVVTASADRTARVWDARTGQQSFNVEHKGAVNYVAVSPDGRLFVTASDDGTAVVSPVDGAIIGRTLRVGLARVNRAVFSHSGKFIVTASADGLASVWDAQTGKKALDLAGHTAEVNTAVFSPDDKLIVTGSNDRTAIIWEFEEARKQKQRDEERGEISKLSANQPAQDVLSPDQVRSPDLVKSIKLSGHEAEVSNAIFSPDGRWVITASQDRTARVWQAVKESGRAAGESLAVLRGHIAPVTCLIFFVSDALSKGVVTGSADRTMRVWDVSKLGGLAVSATVKAATPRFEGDCPVTIKLAGAINAKGSGGTVKYQFITSDGELSKPQELSFDAPGTKEISETWTINRSLSTAWATIRILEPHAFDADPVTVNIRCRNYEGPTAALAKPLTSSALRQIMPGAAPQVIDSYLSHIQRAMDEFRINTPARQAAFLAQVAFNTDELRIMEEIWVPTEAQKRYEPPDVFARLLGNTQPGDGQLFRGRGPFWLSGRTNYRELGPKLGLDLIAQPGLVAQPEVGFRVAGLKWQQLGLNQLADQQDFTQLNRKIGSASAPSDRALRYYDIAKRVLGVSDLESKQIKGKY